MNTVEALMILTGALLPVVFTVSGNWARTARDVSEVVSVHFHELSHAFTAHLVGGSASKIRVDSPKSVVVEGQRFRHSAHGITHFSAPIGLPTILVGMAGYVGPSLFAVLLALLWIGFGPSIASIVGLIVLVFFFFKSRGLATFGVNIVSALAFAPGAFAYQSGDPTLLALSNLFLATLISTLIVTGFQSAVQIAGNLRAGNGEGDSDHEALRDATRLPVPFWSWFFILSTVLIPLAGIGMPLYSIIF